MRTRLLILSFLTALSFAACEPPPPPAPVEEVRGVSFAEAAPPAEPETPAAAPAPAESPTAPEPVHPEPVSPEPEAPVVTHASSGARVPEAEEGAPPLLSFDALASFPYEIHWGMTKEELPKQIPDEVLAWDGKTIRTVGYMLPLQITRGGQVQTFMLLRDLGSCCYGDQTAPAMNRWIRVTVPEGVEARYIAYQPLEVRGRIEVGEEVRYDRVTSIYRMTASELIYTEVDLPVVPGSD